MHHFRGRALLPLSALWVCAAFAAAPVIDTSTWPTAEQPVGAPFSYMIRASESPTSYDAEGLPLDLFINRTTGQLSGTVPRPRDGYGTYILTLIASNASGTTRKDVAMRINTPPVLNPANGGSWTQGVVVNGAYEFTLGPSTAQGFRISSVPAGLVFSTTTGALTGKPATVGTYRLNLTGYNGVGEGTATLTLSVTEPADVPAVLNTGIPETYLDYDRGRDVFANYGRIQITATNEPTRFGVSTGSGSGGFPATLTVPFDPAKGELVYELNTATPGRHEVTLTATNSKGTGRKVLTWSVRPRLMDLQFAREGPFQVGEDIVIRATFNSPVVVTGTPRVSVSNRRFLVPYQSGSGTATLTFVHRTTAADYYPATLELHDFLDLSGATIAHPTGPAAVTNVPLLRLQSFERKTAGIYLPPPSGTTAPTSTPPTVVVTPPATGTTSPSTPAATSTAPSTNPSSSTPVTSTPVTPAVTRTAQTIEFVAPVSSPVMGQPFTLGAISSAGLPLTYAVVSGPGTIQGNALVVTGPGAVVVRASQAGNETVSPAEAQVTISGALKAAQSLTFDAIGSKLASDPSFVVRATSTAGLPVTYAIVEGPATIASDHVTLTGAAGTVVVRATQAGTDSVGAAESLWRFEVTLPPASRLANVSARLRISDADPERALISGFVLGGDRPQRVLIRAAGPALLAFGVPGALPNPRLRVFDTAAKLVTENDDWSGPDVLEASAQLGAFGLRPGSGDAAVVVTLSPGAYSAHVSASGGAGVTLVEVYDASGPANSIAPPTLVNLSTRGHVGTGDDVLAAGFVIAGDVPKRVLVRGVGPALAPFGVSAIADPVLTIYRGPALVAQNDDWHLPMTAIGTASTAAEIVAAAASAGAFALPANSRDAAVLMVLAPGAYTAVVNGANGATGVGLVEVYDLSAGAK